MENIEEGGKPKRTIDELLHAITERVDAVSMNLELTSRTVEANREAHEKVSAEQNSRIDRLITSGDTLLALALSHERRINVLEGGPQQG